MSDENTNEGTNEGAGGNAGDTGGVTGSVITANMVYASKLDIGNTITEGFNNTIQYIGPILVNFLLWVVTIWIPYLNVGTTIGFFSGIVAKMSRGETISYTEIFNPLYRKFMGDYFITAGLFFIGVFIGIIFLIVPAFIICYAWYFSFLLVVDKGKNSIEAIKTSNEITYGYKGKIFLINIIITAVASVIQGVLSIFDNGFASFLIIILTVFQIILMLGIQASMYKQLASDVQ